MQSADAAARPTRRTPGARAPLRRTPPNDGAAEHVTQPMRFSLRILIPILLLNVGLIPSLSAQWPAEITAGTRVRVKLPERQYQFAGPRGQLLRGRVQALTPDTLYLAVTDSVGPIAIPRSLIAQLAFSRGVPSRGESALKRGLVSGAAWALLMALWVELDDDPGGTDTGDAALLGGGVGFATGAIFGAIRPRERWKKLDLPRDAGARIGLALGLRTTF